MKSVYLAGPLGFSELGEKSAQIMKNMLSKRVICIDPFVESSNYGKKIIEISQNKTLGYREIQDRLKEINHHIGKQNAELIKKSDFVIAVLDGVDVDSGTAAEIGFAYGLEKKIFGYRGDFRLSADNLGSIVNLQVEYFINASGGQVFTTIDSLEKYLENEIENI